MTTSFYEPVDSQKQLLTVCFERSYAPFSNYLQKESCYLIRHLGLGPNITASLVDIPSWEIRNWFHTFTCEYVTDPKEINSTNISSFSLKSLFSSEIPLMLLATVTIYPSEIRKSPTIMEIKTILIHSNRLLEDPWT